MDFYHPICSCIPWGFNQYFFFIVSLQLVTSNSLILLSALSLDINCWVFVNSILICYWSLIPSLDASQALMACCFWQNVISMVLCGVSILSWRSRWTPHQLPLAESCNLNGSLSIPIIMCRISTTYYIYQYSFLISAMSIANSTIQ